MPYWGDKPADCDYASGAVGVYVYLIKERMFSDANVVIKKEFPEQAITVSLQCLRALSERFPREASVHFSKSDLRRAKALFEEWHIAVKGMLPEERWRAVGAEAQAEFGRYEKLLLKGRKSREP